MGEREVEAALREAFLAGVRAGRELNGTTPQTNGQKASDQRARRLRPMGTLPLPLRDPPPIHTHTKEVLTLTPDPDPDPDPEKSKDGAKSRRAGGDGGAADFQRYDFGRFWAAYPKKRHKPAAWQAWHAVDGARHLELILAGVERWKASDDWARGFVEDPATFLRQRQWEDEPKRPITMREAGRVTPSVEATRERLRHL